MSENNRSQEVLLRTIASARDSVWVIENEIRKKTQNGGILTSEGIDNIQRNVVHLEIIMADTEITGCGEDVSDLAAAIVTGKAALEG